MLYWLGWCLSWFTATIIFRRRVSGREHIPKEGGFMLATNHISYFDPPFVGSSTTRPVWFFAKAELFSVPILGRIIRRTHAMPVKRGTVDRDALKRAVATIKEGKALTVFPEGTRSKIDGFLSPRPGPALIASHAGCPVVPGYIHGANRLKACFLGREKLRVIFGEPISAEEVTATERSKEGYAKLSELIMNRIRALRDESGLRPNS